MLTFRETGLYLHPMNKILDNYIRSAGKSQADIAKILGISPQLMNYMVKNPKNLKPEQIRDIAKALGRSPRNLFTLIVNN